MNLVYAVADQGTIRIDEYHRNTSDKAYFGGHYYTEKSIGPSVLALPVYIAFRELAVASGLADRPETDGSGTGYARRYHAMAVIFVTFVTVSIPSAITALLLYAFVRRWVTAGVALLAMLAYGLGTIAFPYSSQFYSHQLAATAMFAAFYILWRVAKEGAKPANAWSAGALLGFAVVTEYVMAVAALLLLAWIYYERRDFLDLARVLAAAAPWGLLMAGYNFMAFGTPLPVGYSYTVYFTEVHAQGLMGLTLPSFATLYGITFSPYRGLFFLSPFLLLAVPGFLFMWRAGERSLTILLAGIACALILYNTSYVMWWGGFSIGPRHLIPMLPFLCIPVAWCAQWGWSAPLLRAVAGTFVAVSMGMVWIQTLGGWDFPSDTAQNPLTEYSLPALLQGDLSLNVGMALGLEGHLSLLPFLVLLCIIVVTVPRVLARLAPAIDRVPNTRLTP